MGCDAAAAYLSGSLDLETSGRRGVSQRRRPTGGEAPKPRHRRVTTVKVGAVDLIMADTGRYDWRDPYHAALALPWGAFMLALLGYYLLVNAVFGSLYLLVPGSVANLPPGDIVSAFFFSVETFATVGYGVMAPTTLYGHIVATTEIVGGMLSCAVITGLLFVRFSRPRSSVVFARNIVIAPYDGTPMLMVRLANRRAGMIDDVDARLVMVKRVQTREGFVHYRPMDLKLERPSAQFLAMSMLLMHRIDATSPLHGLDKAGLEAMDGQLIASIAGTDATLNAPVRARQGYVPADILWGHRYADMMTVDAEGRTHLQVARLHQVVPV